MKELTNIEDYSVHFEIGSGGQSKVYFATHILTNTECALKVANSENYLATFNKEISYMETVKSDSLVKNFSGLKKGIFDKRSRFFYAMPLFKEGTLYDYVKVMKGNAFSEGISQAFASQILSSLEQVHNSGYSHNDLKLENL